MVRVRVRLMIRSRVRDRIKIIHRISEGLDTRLGLGLGFWIELGLKISRVKVRGTLPIGKLLGL